jgi:hypothetical protein
MNIQYFEIIRHGKWEKEREKREIEKCRQRRAIWVL